MLISFFCYIFFLTQYLYNLTNSNIITEMFHVKYCIRDCIWKRFKL